MPSAPGPETDENRHSASWLPGDLALWRDLNARSDLCAILAGGARAETLAKLDRNEWAELVDAGCRQGVGPLLAGAISEGGWPDTMDPAQRRTLVATWRASIVHNVVMFGALLDILETLAQRPAVPVVLLKGAALGPTVYPKAELRPMGDLDLLVPRERIDQAVKRLETAGWEPMDVAMMPGLTPEGQRHIRLQSVGSAPVVVELHWTLAGAEGQRHGPDMDWFWAQTEPFDPRRLGLPVPPSLLEGGQAGGDCGSFTLTPTAQPLYLAAHLTLHHAGPGGRLIWFYDLHLVIERQGKRIDWEELVRRADQFHWAPALRKALDGTQALFGTALPTGLLEDLATASAGAPPALGAWGSTQVQTRVTAGLATAATLEWRVLVRYVWGTVMPSPAYLRWRYDLDWGWLWPLYYPYRWADLAGDAVRTLWTVLRRRVESG